MSLMQMGKTSAALARFVDQRPLPHAAPGRVTTLDRAPDWQVTAGDRIMLALGWGALVPALYVAVVASVLGLPGAWWLAGGLAAASITTVVFLPEPVPAEMITGSHNRIDPQRNP